VESSDQPAQDIEKPTVFVKLESSDEAVQSGENPTGSLEAETQEQRDRLADEAQAHQLVENQALLRDLRPFLEESARQIQRMAANPVLRNQNVLTVEDDAQMRRARSENIAQPRRPTQQNPARINRPAPQNRIRLAMEYSARLSGNTGHTIQQNGPMHQSSRQPSRPTNAHSALRNRHMLAMEHTARPTRNTMGNSGQQHRPMQQNSGQPSRPTSARFALQNNLRLAIEHTARLHRSRPGNSEPIPLLTN
jgi:hypothetical protein